MMNKDNLVIVGVVLALIIGGFALFNTPQDGKDGRSGRDGVGVAAGPDKYNMQNFLDSYTSGGGSFNASSTLTTARTITATEFCQNSYIHVNSAATLANSAGVSASLDLTFPATSTIFTQCLNYPGAEKTITFRNNSPTTASTTELVAGVGCDMRTLESADNDIEGLNEARITIRRTDDAFADGGSVDCIILVEETVVD